MAGKLKFLVGMGAGYVLGTRSGRERYDQIVGKIESLWKDPRVQDATEKVQNLAQEHMPGSSAESRIPTPGSSGSGTGSRTSPGSGSGHGEDTGGTGR